MKRLLGAVGYIALRGYGGITACVLAAGVARLAGEVYREPRDNGADPLRQPTDASRLALPPAAVVSMHRWRSST